MRTRGPAPPLELRDRIVQAAREEPPKVVALRPRRTRLYAGIAIAAAACAALAIGLSVGLSGGGGGKKLALSVQPGGTAQLAVSGFDPAPEGKVYEAWVIAGGEAGPRGGVPRWHHAVARARAAGAEGRDRRGHAGAGAARADADAADPRADDRDLVAPVGERVDDLDEVRLRDPVRELDPGARRRARRR